MDYNYEKKRNINNMIIRYITCLDCGHRHRIFWAKNFRRQRCLNEICGSLSVEFDDIRANLMILGQIFDMIILNA